MSDEVNTEPVGVQEQVVMSDVPPPTVVVTDEVDPQLPPEEKIASQGDTDAILDAVKELTKSVSELTAEWQKWRKAGKF
jgi:hypothetical protein